MYEGIRIQMLGNFTIYINEQQADHLVNKSRKGLALMQSLIMNRGARVSNRRLVAAFWPDEDMVNPENALKTLISRMRRLLNQVSDGLGECIASERGSYYWKCLPGMRVDVYELEDIFQQLNCEEENSVERETLYHMMMGLYKGDLLKYSEMNEWAISRATALHNEYVKNVYGYINLLKARNDDKQVVVVCRRALEIDPFDEQLHIELMNALINNHAINEAKAQYDEVMYLYYHYLNVEPSKELKEFYSKIVENSNTIEFNLDSVCRELRESTNEHTAFMCDYTVFKRIFNIQIRNIERLGSTMFLAIVMVNEMSDRPMDSIKQNHIMRELLAIMETNLRKGDIFTHFAPTMIALLLPTVNYNTGDIVMERLKQKFYAKFPNSNLTFSYRIAPLSTNMGESKPKPLASEHKETNG